jgi:hypothetical protein
MFTYTLSKESFDSQLKTSFSPNVLNLFGTPPYQSYLWVKNALNQLGINFDDQLNSVYRMFSAIPDTKIRFLKEDVFRNALNSSFENIKLSNEIPEFSLVFGYFPGTATVFRAIDEMIFWQTSPFKQQMLKKYLSFETMPISIDNQYDWSDSTPLNNLKFSEEGYKTRWDFVKNKDLIGKKIPFVPINHIGIFKEKHLFHLCSTLNTTPTKNLRVVAFLPLYDYYDKSPSTIMLNNSNNISNVGNILNQFNL